jgi:hypothetical protein
LSVEQPWATPYHPGKRPPHVEERWPGLGAARSLQVAAKILQTKGVSTGSELDPVGSCEPPPHSYGTALAAVPNSNSHVQKDSRIQNPSIESKHRPVTRAPGVAVRPASRLSGQCAMRPATDLRADATAQHLSTFASHRTSMPRSLGFKAKQAGRPRPIRVVEVRFG